jgi:hypothetical protein
MKDYVDAKTIKLRPVVVQNEFWDFPVIDTMTLGHF